MYSCATAVCVIGVSTERQVGGKARELRVKALACSHEAK